MMKNRYCSEWECTSEGTLTDNKICSECGLPTKILKHWNEEERIKKDENRTDSD